MESQLAERVDRLELLKLQLPSTKKRSHEEMSPQAPCMDKCEVYEVQWGCSHSQAVFDSGQST